MVKGIEGIVRRVEEMGFCSRTLHLKTNKTCLEG